MSAVQVRRPLSATQQMAHSLMRKRHEEKLQTLRMRVETDPHSGLASQLRKVEHKIMQGDLIGAGEAMLEVDRALSARAEQHATNAAIAQTLAVAKARAEMVECDGEGSRTTAIRILNRDGLLWLRQKKRLSSAELIALERYRTLFDKVHRGPTADSTLAVERGPPSGGGSDRAADLARVDAVWMLDEARDAVGRDEALVWMLDEVAGRGTTLRDLASGDDRQAGRLEAELRVAARLLAKRFGLRG